MIGRIAILVAVLSTSVAAQWLQYRDPTIPRTADGRPDLSAPVPRAPDGRPDLSGVWAAEPSDELKRRNGGDANPLAADLQFISPYAFNILADFKPEEEPIRPESAALLRQRTASFRKDSPMSHCLPGGVPFSTLIAPFKVVQTPRLIVMILEDNNPTRQVHLDGREHPVDPEPSWMGYSVGQWEEDTLVVETRGFNDRTWLDSAGHPHGETLHVTERFRRRDVGHMDVVITIDDPTMYTKPFTVKVSDRLLPDTDILESVCAENEKDRVHLDR